MTSTPVPTGHPELHRNEMLVVGELMVPTELRQRADGEHTTSFRLRCRTPSSSGPPARSNRGAEGEPTVTRRSDTVDCAAASPALQARMARVRVGDVIEVQGALRHRFWRGAGGLASRYEVEVETMKVIKRVDRRSGASPSPTPASE